MAKLLDTPPKYLPSQWHTSNSLNYSKAEVERARAEHLRAECDRLRQETNATTLRTQAANTHKFSQRIRDITFWKSELETSLSEVEAEIGVLLEHKQRLEDALEDTKFPLEVANSCLVYREKRVDIDNVHDQVEIELTREVDVIQKVQESLQRTLDRTTEQIRLLRSCKYRLEKDLTDKLSALGIDDTCAHLSDTSEGIGFSQQDSVKIQTTSVSPEQWASFSNENILKAEEQRQASTTLRRVIDGVLEQSQQDIHKQRATVNLEFSKRISEVARAKTSLEEHLNKVMTEIGAMEENIERQKESISSKMAPMMLAQTRLDLRSQRSNQELVRDPIQYGLVGEVGEISQSVDSLRERLSDSESALKGLIRSQLSLEEDIGVKTVSLTIDRDHCMALRRQLD